MPETRHFSYRASSGRALMRLRSLHSTGRSCTRLRARWRVVRQSKTSPSGAILVGLEWRTPLNDISLAMGFAPFSTMPVSRRAPYVVIATWPGDRLNPQRGEGKTPPARAGEVSFLDAMHGLESADYRVKYEETENRVRALIRSTADDATLYRRTAFVASAAHAERLAVR